MELILKEDILNIKTLINNLTKVTQNLVNNLEITDEEFDIKVLRIAKLSHVVQKQIISIEKISKIKYKQEILKSENFELSLADKQIMARTLVLDGMIIMKPENANELQNLIYQAVKIINPLNTISIEKLIKNISDFHENNGYISNLIKEGEFEHSD